MSMLPNSFRSGPDAGGHFGAFGVSSLPINRVILAKNRGPVLASSSPQQRLTPPFTTIRIERNG